MLARSLPSLTKKIVDRFWSKVDITPGQGPKGCCWEWKDRRTVPRTREGLGYGVFYLLREVGAHRVAYKIYYGIDPRGQHVRHACNNPPCVNPLHLRLGTHQENMKDRDDAGRQVTAHGMEHKLAKLTDNNVRDIRERFAAGGISKLKLANEFNVSHRLIRNILNRTAWQHI